jgi:hypothetical protein
VNDPGVPPPDWDAIFHQARRRMAAKLFVVAAIAALGTMLLLGGGLQAEGSVQLPIISGNQEKDKPEKPKKRKEHRHKKHHKHQEEEEDEEQGHKKHHRHHEKEEPHPKPCKEKEPKDSALEQYEEERYKAEGYEYWPKSKTGKKCPSSAANG